MTAQSPFPVVSADKITTDCAGIQIGHMDCSDREENDVCFLGSYQTDDPLSVFTGQTSAPSSVVQASVYYCKDKKTCERSRPSIRALQS